MLLLLLGKLLFLRRSLLALQGRNISGKLRKVTYQESRLLCQWTLPQSRPICPQSPHAAPAPRLALFEDRLHDPLELQRGYKRKAKHRIRNEDKYSIHVFSPSILIRLYIGFPKLTEANVVAQCPAHRSPNPSRHLAPTNPEYQILGLRCLL